MLVPTVSSGMALPYFDRRRPHSRVGRVRGHPSVVAAALCITLASTLLVRNAPLSFFPKTFGPNLKRDDGTGNTYMITGSTDGIGLYTAEKLAGLDGQLLIHGKSEIKVDTAVYKLQQGWMLCNASGFCVDFTSLNQVRLFGDYIAAEHPFIDGLVLNAGMFSAGDAIRTTTDETGDEENLCANVLAPFLLLSKILPSVMRAKGRLIVTTCDLAECVNEENKADELLDDLQTLQDWKPSKAYRLSKLLTAMFAHEVNERYGAAEGFTVNYFHPGKVNTKIGLNLYGGGNNPISLCNCMFNLLTNDRWSDVTGKYFTPGVVDPDETVPPDVVLDAVKRKEIWERLEALSEAEWPDPADLEAIVFYEPPEESTKPERRRPPPRQPKPAKLGINIIKDL